MSASADATAPRDRELRGLVDRARSGDPDAWELLYRRLRPRLLRYAIRRTGDPVAAEDAVSEAMTRAIVAIDGFRWRGAGFDAWMFGIVRNVTLEDHRRGTRAPLLRSADTGEPTDPDPRRQPESAALAVGDAQLVHAALRSLSDIDREVIDLRIVAELSVEETANVLHKRPGAVRMAQSRALTRLRELVKEASDG